MAVWAALVCLVLVNIRRTEAAEKAVIILDPPWTTIFEGHEITLTCNVPGQPYGYNWNKDYNSWGNGRTKEIRDAKTSDSGVYRCRSSDSEFSDPVSLAVSNRWAILQAPYFGVFEGDELQLNCQKRGDGTVNNVRFYKNSETIHTSSKHTWDFTDLRASDGGAYQCAIQFSTFGSYYESNTQRINVQVLFKTPQLKTTPQRVVVEGQTMTLECYTELNPLKPEVQLLYSFYKDGALVTEDRTKSEIVIANAELADGGIYKCVVQRAHKTVPKPSSSVQVFVQRIAVAGTLMTVLPQSGEAIEGALVTLNCSVTQGTGAIKFSWCRWDPRTCMHHTTVTTMWAEYTIEAITEQDDGKYFCAASNIEMKIITSSEVFIHVKLRVSRPLLTLEADNDGVVVGDRVIIECSCQRGSAPIIYRFYLQDRHVKTVELNQTQPGRYTMSSVSLEEAGVYCCEADNGIQDGVQRSENVPLAIMVPVSGATLLMNRAIPDVLVGENLTLTCRVELGSSPAFHWFHNEKEVDAASKMFQLVPTGNSLHIKSAQKEHGGSYVCQATNHLNQKRTFNSTSNVLSIKVIEAYNVFLIATATLGPLVVIAITAMLAFVCCKRKKKTDDRYFTAPVGNNQIPVQHAPRPSVSADSAQLYSNVSAAASSTNNTDVVYAVIDTKAKRRAPTATLQENLDYYVTYTSVKFGKHDKAVGRGEVDKAEEHDNVYANFHNK